MKFIRDLLSEKGDVSMMRVMALISLCVAAGLAIAGHDIGSVMVFITAAFGGKVGQKALENKGKEG